MDRETLKQYRDLVIEIKQLEKRIEMRLKVELERDGCMLTGRAVHMDEESNVSWASGLHLGQVRGESKTNGYETTNKRIYNTAKENE